MWGGILIVQSSKTFRVFVSSTFADLIEERNALQREVFPKLRDLCMEHGFRFQAIDLRWGVSEEAGLDQQTMKICLEEIERSQRVSPKPNFIVLLGDRYGWRPLPYEIPADEFEEIEKHVSEENLPILHKWYWRDDNAVPPLYDLQSRNGENVDFGVWSKVEEDLRNIFLKAVEKANFSEAQMFKYNSSATEQEILKGVLNLPENLPDAKEHVFGFFRKINVADDFLYNESSKNFFDFDGKNRDTLSEEKLDLLKGLIADKLPSSNIFHYNAQWEENSTSQDHIDKLCEDVLFSLEKVIKEQINEYTEHNHLDLEIKAHKEFGKERSKFFIGREENLEKITNYLETPNSKPMIVYGNPGSGKSSLIAKTVEYSNPNFYEKNVLYNNGFIVRFIGATPESSDINSLLESLCLQIYNDFNFDEQKQRRLGEIQGTDERAKKMRDQIESEFSISSELEGIHKTFLRFLGMIPPHKRLILFLDAIDQFTDSEGAHDLYWIPTELPENLHIILSTLTEPFHSFIKNRIIEDNSKEVAPIKKSERISIFKSILNSLKKHSPSPMDNNVLHENTSELLPLKKSEGKLILNLWFNEEKTGRKLTNAQEQELIDKFEANGLPLYLKLAFEEAKIWKSYTPVPDLKSDIKGIIHSMLERLSKPEKHNKILVSHSLGYLAAAKAGLTEDEMLDILALDKEVFSLTKKFHNPTEEKLPVVLWSRLYFDLDQYLTEKSSDDITLLSFYHRLLGDVISEEYLTKAVEKERHKLLADYFYKKADPLNDISFSKIDYRIHNELPFQLKKAEMWNELRNLLTSYNFIKCKVKYYYIYTDYYINYDNYRRAYENFDFSGYLSHIIRLIPDDFKNIKIKNLETNMEWLTKCLDLHFNHKCGSFDEKAICKVCGERTIIHGHIDIGSSGTDYYDHYISWCTNCFWAWFWAHYNMSDEPIEKFDYETNTY